MVALIFQRRDTVFLNDLPITRVCMRGFISKFDSICPKQCSIGRTWWFLQYLTFTMLFWDQNNEHWWFSVCFPGSLPLKGRVTCCYVVKYENCATFMHDKMGMQCKYFIITMCICSFGPSFKYLHSQIIKNIIYTCQKVFSQTSTFSLAECQKKMHAIYSYFHTSQTPSCCCSSSSPRLQTKPLPLKIIIHAVW